MLGGWWPVIPHPEIVAERTEPYCSNDQKMTFLKVDFLYFISKMFFKNVFCPEKYNRLHTAYIRFAFHRITDVVTNIHFPSGHNKIL